MAQTQPAGFSGDAPGSVGADRPRGILGWIERAGNALPDPTALFVLGCLLIMLLSAVAAWQGWSVTPTVAQAVLDEAGDPVIDPATGRPRLDFVPKTNPDGSPQIIKAVNLLSSDGIFWALDQMVLSFITFPPLGVVVVGMLGIGVAEKTGLFGALLRAFMLVVPPVLFTPSMVFLGIMSSMGLDAGYVVLPPLAAALYASVGRSPLAGIAAAFAGIAAGFNANLLVTGLDPLLAGLSTSGAQIVDPSYEVAATCNWYFMAASTIVMTFVGWAVTAWVVEPRLSSRSIDEGGAAGASAADLESQRLSRLEWKGMTAALVSMTAILALVIVLVLVPGSPLHGNSPRQAAFARWVAVIVPLIFFAFLVPGLVYGMVLGNIRSTKDAAAAMVEAISAIAPIIVLAFFAAQFIAWLNYSQLGQMLAFAGGKMLARAELAPWALILAFIAVIMLINLLISSMSAKYAIVAPIFVPMLMLVGISPELTQAAYRIGDSVTNTITPLNAYLVIILMFMHRYARNTGLGTLVATMLPYSIAFVICWAVLLLAWMWVGIPLGPNGPLTYPA
jgi:aminobenzoyl-glutamate transport protein